MKISMRILVTSPKKNNGFSLIEVLVVLLILSLLSGVVAPNFSFIYDAVERKTQVEGIKNLVNDIGFQSIKLGQTIDEHSFVSEGVLSNYLPRGWKISGNFIYRNNGACEGGLLRLYHKNELILEQNLLPPFCRLHAEY